MWRVGALERDVRLCAGPHPHISSVSAHLVSPPVDHSTVSLPFSPCSSSKDMSVRFSGYKNHALRAHRRRVAVAADISSAGDRYMQKLALLEAILLDGTLCDSDPFHFLAFRELLQKFGFIDGVPSPSDQANE